MNDQIRLDALNIRKLVREAEAVSDEAMAAFSKLKLAMLQARQNPGVAVDVGQRAILRLVQAEQQAMSMSTNLLRVHDELSKVARESAGLDEDIPTEIKPSGIIGSDTCAEPAMSEAV
ncbi:hypothetical protein [Altererythrobacter aquiaggeris]|uniref:hypothetical protein n=1 Tax=Aestuarierythrobacter aquiaggeris TaxID=1898396 RepID=UPI003015B2A4